MKILRFILPVICILSTSLFARGTNQFTCNVNSGNAEFAFTLYNSMKEGSNNFVISPFSISSSLTLALLGAEGDTYQQMLGVLNLPDEKGKLDLAFSTINRHVLTTRGPSQVVIANGLFTQQGTTLPDIFQNRRSHFFNREGIQQHDFTTNTEGVRQQINTWLTNNTNNVLGEVIPEGTIDQNTRLVLANALYFQAPWKNGFDPNLTYSDLFNGQTADFMVMNGPLSLAQFDGYRMLEVPFKEANAKLSLFVVLPDDGQTLEEVEDAISYTQFTREWLTLRNKQQVNFHFPKFALSFSIALRDALIALGMDMPFTTGFSWSNTALNDVFHAATLSFDEGGAYATTRAESLPPIEGQTNFIVNKPFRFFIVNKTTHTILFVGRVETL